MSSAVAGPAPSHGSFLRVIWVLPLTFALHEAEEWNILAWHHQRWVNPPPGTDLTVWTWLVFISLVGFAWTGTGVVPRRPRFAAWFVLPFFLFFVVGNALQHLVLLVIDRGYNPGAMTAVLAVLPSAAWVASRALRERLVPAWYPPLLVALTLPSVIGLARAGDRLPQALHAIYRFAGILAQALFGRT